MPCEIDVDVLSFPGSIPPDRCGRNGFGSQANGGHCAKTDSAWHNRILSVESECAAAVRGCHSDIFQHFIYSATELEIRISRGIAQFKLKSLS
jgi:hypothetical protein